MLKPQRCKRPSTAPARHCAWLMCLCLLLLLTACAAPAPVALQIDPPPASLAAPCWAGPDWPAGDSTIGEVLVVALERESAAAECRARHERLVKAWPRP